MTTVTASVVSTGERARVRACLESLARQEFNGEIRVVVVCNGVSDGSDVAARAAFPSATIVTHRERRGFAENHNLALETVHSDFGLVLNPDVILAPHCIHELIAAMERHPRAGVVGPLLRYPGGEVQPSARRFPRLGGTLVRRTPLRVLAGERLRRGRHYLPPPEGDRAVDWILGACLMMRAQAWRDTGGFDAAFRPLYVEDVDLAWRMWRAGWEVWQSPAAEAEHEHQAATDKSFLDRRTLWHARGMLRFVRKHPGILISGARPRPIAPTARTRAAVERR